MSQITFARYPTISTKSVFTATGLSLIHIYGIELSDLFGEPISYVCPEIERRVTEALIQDTRINSCSTFSFDTREQGTVGVSFIVHSIYGDFDMNTEVSV